MRRAEGVVACSAAVAIARLAAHSSLATGREIIVPMWGMATGAFWRSPSLLDWGGSATGVPITGALRGRSDGTLLANQSDQ